MELIRKCKPVEVLSQNEFCRMCACNLPSAIPKWFANPIYAGLIIFLHCEKKSNSWASSVVPSYRAPHLKSYPPRADANFSSLILFTRPTDAAKKERLLVVYSAEVRLSLSPLSTSVSLYRVISVAHHLEPSTPILTLCHGVFTERFIFTILSREIGYSSSLGLYDPWNAKEKNGGDVFISKLRKFRLSFAVFQYSNPSFVYISYYPLQIFQTCEKNSQECGSSLYFYLYFFFFNFWKMNTAVHLND